MPRSADNPNTMNWLPTPVEFRTGLRDAVSIVDPDTRLAELARLARCRLGYLETIQLDGALRKASATDTSGLPRVRLALLTWRRPFALQGCAAIC
jgi:hypothetical protein